jgi:CubicO group peptidase (beta-lactamase class C family)
MLQETYRKPILKIMRSLVLDPIGMSNSTYEQALPAEADRRAARAHSGSGKAMDAKWHVYPEQPAAGLWTTPTDLAKLGIELQKALAGESKVLSRIYGLEMIACRPVRDRSLLFAIGFGIQQRGEGWYFVHSGANWGFHCYVSMHRLKGYGIAVMTTSDSGGRIIGEIEARVAAAANWDSLDKPRRQICTGG